MKVCVIQVASTEDDSEEEVTVSLQQQRQPKDLLTDNYRNTTVKVIPSPVPVILYRLHQTEGNRLCKRCSKIVQDVKKCMRLL